MTDTTTHLSRRSVLAAAAAACGALAARALGSPLSVDAANGDRVRVGRLNSGTATTRIRNTRAANDAVALKGLITTTGPGGATAGVWGESAGQDGTGVVGLATNTGSGTNGVWGRSAGGRGVYGEATGTSGGNLGVQGDTPSPNGTGVYGYARAPTGNNRGLFGRTDSNAGVAAVGFAASNSGSPGGVLGITSAPSGYGVFGESFAGTGVGYGVRGYAASVSGYAGYFTGSVHVQGALTKSSGAFLIDHPEDPANRTLSHAFVEAPEMLNVYRGNARLDDRGRATVRLPRYFRALNTDFSYQLTPVGGPAPGLHVSREVAQNRFSIAGGAPGQKVCWIVTGVRRDAWARANPLRVEQRKRRQDRGRYLNPEVFDQQRSAAMHPVRRVRLPRAPRRRQRPKQAA